MSVKEQEYLLVTLAVLTAMAAVAAGWVVLWFL